MDRAAVFAVLTDVFRDVFQNDGLAITNETTAADVPRWDSLSNIQMILAVERAFKIRLTAAQVSGLKNVGGLVDVIRVKLEAKG
jgi:acyl carrier protein